MIYLAFALALMALGAGTAIWGYQRGNQHPLNRIAYDKWYKGGWAIAVLSAPCIVRFMGQPLTPTAVVVSLVWGGVFGSFIAGLILKHRDA